MSDQSAGPWNIEPASSENLTSHIFHILNFVVTNSKLMMVNDDSIQVSIITPIEEANSTSEFHPSFSNRILILFTQQTLQDVRLTLQFRNTNFQGVSFSFDFFECSLETTHLIDAFLSISTSG